jgi:hypothetical protein
MRKDLIRRLEKLEARHPQIEIVGVLWCSTPVEMRRALAPNERRVKDWYVQPDDVICALRRRITSDPSDFGRNYRRDATGNEYEDLNIVREISRNGDIISVVRKTNTNSLLTHGTGRDAGKADRKSVHPHN